ncbi:TAXI family TRAP transporter solute-binding subunit [Cryobacterium sp. PH31-L1]|uniref:TAXI family TRAP transporter solute-binding subunit n=1 Tax=Cryobacterium sp. PH31-L1 TaxID=3046199 RepID=UPI0024B9EFB5|nr:TAXI family TRAP transporter solute-binding subunit [Cryobacterium sp. PH31-L1]MDJ0377318.1 TAXI family TRAP transporter solute-binding subunit [Cryobacterium sp. PH31-L1]
MTIRSRTIPQRRTVRIAIAALAVPALFLTACSEGGGATGGSTALSIATGGTGGVYYPLGGGIATMIGNDIEGYSATVQETNASVDNLLLIQTGSADLALVVGDVVSDAVDGVGSFADNAADICSLGNLYNNYMQLVTSAGTGIESVEDMKGLRVSVGSPSSATEVGAIRILEAAGINVETDIDRRQLGAAETADALRDGTIDAGFWSGGLPTGALVDYASTGDMVLVNFGEYADALATDFGAYYVEQDIPANTYEGQTEAVSVIVSPNLLVASNDMDETLQEQITAAVFDNKEALIQVHPAAEELDAATAGNVPYITTCAGAQTYFDQAS